MKKTIFIIVFFVLQKIIIILYYGHIMQMSIKVFVLDMKKKIF